MNDSRRNGLPVETFRRRSQFSKACTIRHTAMYVVMTYVHTDIFHKRPPQLTNVLEGMYMVMAMGSWSR